jgi:exosortase
MVPVEMAPPEMADGPRRAWRRSGAGPSGTGPGSSRFTQLLLALGLVALVGALFAPTLAWLVRSWWVHPYYAHGLLMPAVAAWFLWRGRAAWSGGQPSDVGFGLIGAGIAVHLAALRYDVYPLSAAALLLVLAGIALLAGGRLALRSAVFPLLLLAIAIPLPATERIAPFLAAAVAGGAAEVVAASGVAVTQTGAQLTVGDGAFVVGAPCSGLRSLLALSTLAVVLAGLLEGPRRYRALLVVLAVPLALVANGVRLAGLLWVAGTLGVDQGLAFFHGPASPILFVLAAAGLLACGRWLGCDVPRRATV